MTGLKIINEDKVGAITVWSILFGSECIGSEKQDGEHCDDLKIEMAMGCQPSTCRPMLADIIVFILLHYDMSFTFRTTLHQIILFLILEEYH